MLSSRYVSIFTLETERQNALLTPLFGKCEPTFSPCSAGVDPYALIMCEGKTVRTPTLQNTRNPEWNSGALFYVRRPKKTHLIVQVIRTS